MGEPAVAPLLEALRTASSREMFEHVCDVLVQIGIPAVEPLMAALRDEDPDLRGPATWILGQIGDPRAVGPLLAALQDESGPVRVNAVVALEYIGRIRAAKAISDRRTIEALIERLQDTEPSVRFAAAEVLGQFGDSRAIEPLRRLYDYPPGIPKAVKEAIAQIEQRERKSERNGGD